MKLITSTPNLLSNQPNWQIRAVVLISLFLTLFIPVSTLNLGASSSSGDDSDFINEDPPDIRFLISENSVEYGKCIRRFIWFDFPGFPQSKHHDVFFKFPILNTEYIRGFFADSHAAAQAQAAVWHFYKRIYYIDGTVRNVARRKGTCTVQTSASPWGSVEGETIHQIRYKSFTNLEWTQFHVAIRNCQNWASAVLN